jgi:HEAT repeat protein
MTMNDATALWPRKFFGGVRGGIALLVFAGITCVWNAAACAQTAPTPAPTKPDTAQTDDMDAPAATLAKAATPEERTHTAWIILEDAARDTKHAPTRIQSLAALGMLRSPRSERMIVEAMADPDVDVRTAAALAAGLTKDRNLTTSLRNLLDDKEPQVVFTAAVTLWKMGDRSGEDVLIAIASGDTSAVPTLIHGTEHRLNRDLHDPAMLARVGALQGATMLLGPFGFGVTAFEFLRQSGGNLARVSAIEQISQAKTQPIHKELLTALEDKDAAVRVAAAKALVGYRDRATTMALYTLLADSKYPVRLTSAAAYLRTTGTPGPPVAAIMASSASATGAKANR